MEIKVTMVLIRDTAKKFQNYYGFVVQQIDDDLFVVPALTPEGKRVPQDTKKLITCKAEELEEVNAKEILSGKK